LRRPDAEPGEGLCLRHAHRDHRAPHPDHRGARADALRSDGSRKDRGDRLGTWGPRHGPQAPKRSARPGQAVARLCDAGKERHMRLEMGTFSVTNIAFGRTTRYDAGRLTVDRDAVLAAVQQDPRIASAELEIARPGESVRIWPVRDVIEPRIKV